MPAWKTMERDVATALQWAAAKVRDPVLASLVTSTGRTGHLTELGFDALAGNPQDGVAVVAEVKRRKQTLVKEMLGALVQIATHGYALQRIPLLVFHLPDTVHAWQNSVKGKFRITRDWVMLPFDELLTLLVARRAVALLLPHHHNQEIIRQAMGDEAYDRIAV